MLKFLLGLHQSLRLSMSDQSLSQTIVGETLPGCREAQLMVKTVLDAATEVGGIMITLSGRPVLLDTEAENAAPGGNHGQRSTANIATVSLAPVFLAVNVSHHDDPVESPLASLES